MLNKLKYDNLSEPLNIKQPTKIKKKVMQQFLLKKVNLYSFMLKDIDYKMLKFK